MDDEDATHHARLHVPSAAAMRRFRRLAHLDCTVPIFTPSRGRADTAKLNLRHCMFDDRAGPGCTEAPSFLQFVVVAGDDVVVEDGAAPGPSRTVPHVAWYRWHWPDHILLELPPAAISRGISDARYWINRFAKAQGYTWIMVLDDAVAGWFEVALAGDGGGKNRAAGAAGVQVAPLWRVLDHFQRWDDTSDRDKFAVHGFYRHHPKHTYPKTAYAHKQVVSAVLHNVPWLRRHGVRYRRGVWCMEDLLFNRDVAAAGGVVCKWYRFAQNKVNLGAGGCAGLLGPTVFDLQLLEQEARRHVQLALQQQLQLGDAVDFGSWARACCRLYRTMLKSRQEMERSITPIVKHGHGNGSGNGGGCGTGGERGTGNVKASEHSHGIGSGNGTGSGNGDEHGSGNVKASEHGHGNGFGNGRGRGSGNSSDRGKGSGNVKVSEHGHGNGGERGSGNVKASECGHDNAPGNRRGSGSSSGSGNVKISEHGHGNGGERGSGSGSGSGSDHGGERGTKRDSGSGSGSASGNGNPHAASGSRSGGGGNRQPAARGMKRQAPPSGGNPRPTKQGRTTVGGGLEMAKFLASAELSRCVHTRWRYGGAA